MQVNIKLADLFPPDPSGRRLVSTEASSSSGSSSTPTGGSRRLTSTLVQAAGGASGRAASSAAASGSARPAGSGLSAYMRSNPTVAPALQELTGGRRNPSASDSSDAKSVKLCDLFTDSSCSAAGARRKLLRGHLQRLTMVGQRMRQAVVSAAASSQHAPTLPAAAAAAAAAAVAAAAAQHASVTSRRSLQQRDNLTSSQVEGLASWARQAPDSDVQYVQAIVGGGFIGGAQATPQLTIDQVVGPQRASDGVRGRRKAARKMLLLLPPVVRAPGGAGSSSSDHSSSVDSRSGGRTLLDGEASAGGASGTSTGTGTAAAAGGNAQQADTPGRDAAGAGAGAGAAPEPRAAGPAAGRGSSEPAVVGASGSSLGLQEWAARGASPQDVQGVKEIGGKQVLAPTSRPTAEDVKLGDVGGR
ncbi:hypothetical protein COO60DRAFT_1639004 [Scenedesmus sp. NREL 46B-D3]|nr:hypothetical protein COO60DRAFT_1639004 [Scenedesmus sp. NREL 46B-D3]